MSDALRGPGGTANLSLSRAVASMSTREPMLMSPVHQWMREIKWMREIIALVRVSAERRFEIRVCSAICPHPMSFPPPEI
jgi:hypothetical protein